MKTIELARLHNTHFWRHATVHPEREPAFICHDGLRKYFDLPRNLERCMVTVADPCEMNGPTCNTIVIHDTAISKNGIYLAELFDSTPWQRIEWIEITEEFYKWLRDFNSAVYFWVEY